MALEIYYLIESISTATERHPTCAGSAMLAYHGKGNELLYMDTTDGRMNVNDLTPYFVRKYGYKREYDAKRNWSFTHPQNGKAWKTETRIVRAWVRKDGNILIC